MIKAQEALGHLATTHSDAWDTPDACATWRALYAGLQKLEADLIEHIQLENNVLFPRALNA